MENKVVRLQKDLLKVLSNKIDDFYLAGGTALANFYFRHRISFDLDFFTKRYSIRRINEIVKYIESKLNKKVKLKESTTDMDTTKMCVYYINDMLRIDFVKDDIKLLKPLNNFNGINVLSLEDIYLRKIYALCGIVETVNSVGRKKFLGGREEAKDFYDIYCLSEIFMDLSDFVDKYCDSSIKESLIRWFRSYDRMNMISGLLDLKTKKIDYKKIEQHYKKEIDRLIEKEI